MPSVRATIDFRIEPLQRRPFRLSFLQQRGLQRCTVPNTRRDKMIRLALTDLPAANRHRLHALAVSGPDQTRDVQGAHLAPRRMGKPG